MALLQVFMLSAFIAVGQAGPIKTINADDTVCSQTCTENTKFGYQPGSVYQYQYHTETTNKMNGASDQDASMIIDASVEIEPISRCDLVMSVTDASLLNSGDASKREVFRDALTRQSIKFSFQDGKIADVCPMMGEPTWVLNIKRGILSAFQNSMDNLDRDVNVTETDVVGSCLTKYTVKDNHGDKTRTIQKTKDLLSCNDRESYRVAVQSVRYDVPSNVKSLPLLKSFSECDQIVDVKSNILRKSACTEEHIFRPFSNGNSGAMTRQRQVMSLTNTRRSGRPSNQRFSYRTSLLFQHEHGMPNQRDAEQTILSKMQHLCRTMSEGVRPDLPTMVNDLIDSMRHVDVDVLQKIHNKISRTSFCQQNVHLPKKYFLDAIPMVGTTASVKMIQDLISKKHVTGADAQLWLLSLSFIHHPSKEMVAAVTPLLDDSDISGNTILAVSSLASSYCNVNPNCGGDREIDVLIGKLVKKIGNCDRSDSRIIHALRALGNVGHSTKAVSRLSQCFTRKTNPMEVRISAIDAFRRIPCDAMRSDLMGIFRDESEDSEIRINAYLAVMKCPSESVLLEVRESLLKRVTSNQVGSFVWSHLTNLMETSDPHLQQVRSILEDEELKKAFDLDSRKFSRNYEGSFLFESINTGARVDSNVIFSSKSFVPRSANLNLTVDLFGHAINILEVGGRIEGLEGFLEMYFSSYKKSNTPKKGSAEMEKITAAIYMRMFGNELYYHDNVLTNSMDLIKKGESSLLKNVQLLDSRMVIPTCIGLPLNLTVTSTGGINFDGKHAFTNGKFNAELKLSAAIEVKGEMCVDAHLTKTGLKMLTRAHTSSGVEVSNNKDRTEIRFPRKKTEFFNVKSEFYTIHGETEKKRDLITDNVQKSKICTGQTMKTFTGLRFCQEVQFVNTSTSKTAPFFPFTGPFSYDLYMTNEDAPNNYVLEAKYPSPNGYIMIDTPGSKMPRKTLIKMDGNTVFLAVPWRNLKMEGTLINSRSLKSVAGHLSFDNKEYKMLAKIEIDATKNIFKLVPRFELSSPQDNISVKGNMEYVAMKSLDISTSATGSMFQPITLKLSGQNIPKGMAATSVLKIGKKEYSAIARLGKLPKKFGFKYNPYAKVTVLGKDVLQFESELSYDGKNKGSLEVILDKIFSKPVSLNALTSLNIGKSKNKHTARITFKSPKGGFKLTGDLDNKPLGVSSRVIASYNFGAKYSDRLILSTKTRTINAKNAATYSGSTDLISKKRNWLNFNVKGKLTKTNSHLDTNLDLYYGNPKNKATNNLKVNSVINYKNKPVAREYNIAMSVKHPGKKINFQVSADHFHTATKPMRKIENNIMVQISPKYHVKTGLFYSNVKVKGLHNTDVKVSLAYPGRNVEFEEKLQQLNSNAYENEVCVQWQTDKMVRVKTTYRNSSKVLSVENVVGFPNKRQAKVTATVNMAERAYEAIAAVHVDKQIFALKEDIDYKAVSSVKYDVGKDEISGDAALLLEWAPDKKINATGSLVKIAKGTTVKLDLTTPFKSLQSYSETSEQVISRNKCTYSSHSVLKSENNKVELKQRYSSNFVDKEFDYDFNSVINRITSNAKFSLKFTEIKKAVVFLIRRDQKTHLDIRMAHNAADRSQVNSDASMTFDMFDSKGHVKVAMQNDDREMTTSGDYEMSLPNYRIDHIGGSYSVRHNQAKSSINLGYTSSLRYYRNGKISTTLIRGLPKRLKGGVSVTNNNEQLLKMDVEYARSKDNFDVSAELTGPDAKKITASFNLNMSGARKTSHAEIKSGSIDASVDGAVEFEAGRYFDSELRIGSGGKNLVLSGNYKIESSSIHKISADLGLPDSRHIKTQATFMNGDRKSFSFTVDSPDFPSLTSMNTEISYQAEGRDIMAKASLKVLPYLEKLQLKASRTKDRTTEAGIELETHFDTIRQAKIFLSLEGNWRQSEVINFRTEFNDRKVFVLKSFYNVKSAYDFNVNIAASTSHRRYDQFSFDITHKGDWDNRVSSMQMKVAKEFMFNSNMKNSPRQTELSSKISLRNFDDWETQFVRNGDFAHDDVVMTLSHKIGNTDQYTCDVTFVDHGKQTTLQLVAPRGVKFNVDLTIDPENIDADLEVFFQSGSDNYKFTAIYNHMSKVVLKCISPSYNCKLMTSVSGTLEMFKYQAEITHNNAKYEFSLSNRAYYREIKATLMTPSLTDSLDFTLAGDLDTFNMIFEAKHNKDVYQVKASNEKYYKNINFDLTAPRFETHIKMDNTLRNLNGVLNVLVKNVKYELTYSSKDYYELMKLTVSIPKHELVVKSNVDSKKNGVNGDATLVYNKKKFSLGGTYKNFGRKMVIKADLKTPYFNDDLSLTISGKLKKFNVVAKLQHDKDMYELVASNKAYYKTLDINFYLPGGKAKLDFEGELKRFKAFAAVTIDKQQYKLILSNQNYLKGVNAELTTPELGHSELKFDFGGNPKDFHLSVQLLRKKTEYSFATSVDVDSHSYSLALKSPIFSLAGNIINGFETSSVKTKLVYDSESYELAASNENYLESMSFNMSSPQLGVQKLTVQLQGGRSMTASFENNGHVYQCIVSLQNKDILVNVSSPDNKGYLKAKFNEHIKDFSVNGQLQNSGKTYKVKIMNNNFKHINIRVVKPDSDDVDILVENTGSMSNGKNRVKATFGEYSIESSANVQLNENKFLFQLKPSFKSRKTSASFNFGLQSNFGTKELTQTFVLNINGRKSSVKTNVNLSRGLAATLVFDDLYTGDVQLKINVEPMKLNRIKSTLTLKSRMTGVITLVHQHELTKTAFTSMGHIETGTGGRLAGYEVEMTSQQKYGYNVKLDYKNEKYVVSSKASHDGSSSTGIFQLKTPFRNLKDLSISAELDAGQRMKVSVTLPKQYYGATFNYNDGGFSAEVDIQMDRSDREKQFKISTKYVNNDYRTTLFRKVSLKLMEKDVTLTANFHVKKSSDGYSLKAEYSWGESDNEKLGAELEMKTVSGKNEAVLSLILPRRIIHVTGSVESHGDQHAIMFTLTPDLTKANEKIELRADVSNRNSKNIIDMIIKFPNQKNGMRLKTITSGRQGNTIFSSRSQFSVDQNIRKTLTVDVKMTDYNGNYTIDFLADHPFSNFAMNIIAFAASTTERYSTGVEVTYLNHKRQQQNFRMRADINKLRRELNFEVISPKNQMAITGTLDTGKHYSVSLNKQETGMKDMYATASINPDARNVHLELNYDQANPDKVFHINGELMRTKMMMKAYRTFGEQKVSRDGRLIVEIRPTNILFFQLLWNTHMLREMTDYGFDVFQKYGRQIQSLGETIGEILSEEVGMKGKMMRRSFSTDLKPVTVYLPAAYEDIYGDLAKHSEKIGEFYERNAFYVKSVGDSMMEGWETMWTNYQQTIEDMKTYMQHFNDKMAEKLDEAKIFVDSYYSQFENQYQISKAQLFQTIDQMFQYAEEQFNNGFEHLTSLHQEINMFINKSPAVMKRFQSQIKEHPVIAKAIDHMMDLYQSANAQKEALFASHGDVMNVTRPMVGIMLSISNDIYKHVLKTYGYLHLGDVLPDMKEKLIRFLKKEIATLKKAWNSIDGETLVFDPKNGEITAQLNYHGLVTAYSHILSSADSLDEVSRSLSKYSDKLSAFSDWTVYDAYYHVKPTSDMNNWIPPFKAHASLFGGEHITTFDGRVLNFRGTCSYVLARAEGNFKIAAHYSSNKGHPFVESISIDTETGNQIKIHKDYTVHLNGRIAKLPVSIADAHIRRQGEFVVVEGLNGYKVSCNPKSDLYSVDISGWYFNKVAGLFGTYDNEHTNDMTMANMHSTNDLQEFANSWSLSRSCRSQNRGHHGHMVPENQQCDQLFLQRHSPLRNCFKLINPDSFYRACANYMDTVRKTSKVICDVASYYVTECHYKGVDLTLPTYCTTQ